nr:unnamed protein product [Digitaria exilis]
MPTLRSATASVSPAATPSPVAASTPRSVKRRLTPGLGGESLDSSRHTSPHRSPHAGAGTVFTPKMLSASPKSSRKRLYGDLMRAVKEALHLGTVPSCELVCRDNEQRRVFEFCKACVEQEKAGSMYVCGCPGTGKTLSINKVMESLAHWADEVGMETPDWLATNCTNLGKTSDIFSKILGQFQNRKKGSSKLSPLQQLQSMFSNKELAPKRMMLVIVDEMDYLITRDRAVLHDLFMLTTCPYSRCILIGIANAIDLADRFLPKLESLNCKPLVVTFRAYSKDQICDIIKHRLKVLEYDVFEPLALEFCARKVAAATGDMRKALGVCRSAVEVLEARLQDSDKELGILNKSYIEICRSTQVPAVGMLEFSNMCMVLSDQGFMKLGQSKEDKLRRVTLQIDISDIGFAFKVRAKVLNPVT